MANVENVVSSASVPTSSLGDFSHFWLKFKNRARELRELKTAGQVHQRFPWKFTFPILIIMIWRIEDFALIHTLPYLLLVP